MKIAYFFLFISLIAACKSKTSPEQKVVDDAFSLASTQPVDSHFIALQTAISNYIDLKGYADSTSARYLLSAAQLASTQNRTETSLAYYKKYMSHYTTRPDQADKLAEVIPIVEKLNKPELNEILYKSFTGRFPSDPRTAGYAEKITSKEITVDSTLKYIGMNMFNDTSFRLNEAMAMLYIEACELAAMADPKLTNAPEHLHRAAETARTLRDVPRAIELYNWIIELHPDHPRGATSMFLKAFTYDNELKDFEKAGKYYNEFLTKYPNDEFAESARFLLDNLGKSEEEFLKILEDKAKENVQ